MKPQRVAHAGITGNQGACAVSKSSQAIRPYF
jgi:hypothetical protein